MHCIFIIAHCVCRQRVCLCVRMQQASTEGLAAHRSELQSAVSQVAACYLCMCDIVRVPEGSAVFQQSGAGAAHPWCGVCNIWLATGTRRVGLSPASHSCATVPAQSALLSNCNLAMRPSYKGLRLDGCSTAHAITQARRSVVSTSQSITAQLCHSASVSTIQQLTTST